MPRPVLWLSLYVASLAVSLGAAISVKVPTLVRPNAAEKTVEGRSDDTRYRIRIKVFDGNGNEVQHSETVAEPQDHTFIAGFRKPLEPGQVVRAYLVIGGTESLPSSPVTVAGQSESSHNLRPERAVEQNPGFARPMLSGVSDQSSVAKNDKPEESRTVKPSPQSTGRSSGGGNSSHAQSSEMGAVELYEEPKEGQKTLYVGASQPANNQRSLSVYVDGKPVRLIDSSGNQTSFVPVTTNGDTAIQLASALDGGQCVRVVEFDTGKRPQVKPDDLTCPDSQNSSTSGPTKDAQGIRYSLSRPIVTSAFFDYGRVRTYLAAGTLFSYDGGSFSQPSIFLSLSAYRNWRWARVDKKRVMFDTFFEARLTTVPVPACVTTVSTSSSGSNQPSPSTCPS